MARKKATVTKRAQTNINVERRKSNLKQELLAKNDYIKGVHDGDNKELSLLGISALTSAKYNNSMRTTMFITHTAQFVNTTQSEFPRVSFGAENTVGKYSDGYLKNETKKRVYKRIDKYGKLIAKSKYLDEPLFYLLFLYDAEEDEYSVVERKPCEDRTEIFGYNYNNEVIDKYEVGDEIPEGEVLYRSSSYDEDMNYGYALNAKIVYTLDPDTYEDAARINEDFAQRISCPEIEEVDIGINHNDYLLNTFGSDIEHYQTLPKLGQTVNGILCVKRTMYSNQALYDFRNDNLSRIMEGDTVIYKTGQVLDYKIYCNNPDIPDNTFNRDVLKLLKHQNAYWQEVYDTTLTIINSGSKYTRNVDYLYKKSKEMLDCENTKWKEGDSEYSNLFVRVLLRKDAAANKGQKFSPRYGNKSVVSRIVPREEMMYYYDDNGKKQYADIYLNLLAIINRTTAYPLFELAITLFSDKCVRYMRTLKTRDEQEKVLFEFLYDFEPDYGVESQCIYMSLSEDEKDDYMKFVLYGDNKYNHGLFIRDISALESRPVFYRLLDMYNKYKDTWFTHDQCYVNKWGREIPVLCDETRISEMYVMRLKQTSAKQFSARSTGAINSKSLPERSYKSRSHQEKNSSTPIRFGEYETLTFSIAQEIDDHALFHALYRTSIKGRNDLAKIMINPDLDEGSLDDSYCSRTAEIFNVILLSLGFELEFYNEDDVLEYVDTRRLSDHNIGNKSYICSDFTARMLERISEIENGILSEGVIMDRNEVYDLVRDTFVAEKKIMGSSDEAVLDSIFNLYYDK